MQKRDIAKRLSNTASRASGSAIAGDHEARADRRSHERFVTVFRLAKLIGTREEFSLVRNVSTGGLKVEVYSPKAVGDKLSVDFGDEHPLPAHVAWVADDSIGISFDEPVNLARVLSKTPPPGRSRVRPVRLLVEVSAMVVTPTSREDCQLIDISQGGAKIRMETGLNPGDKITVEVEGLGKLACVVRWRKHGNTGVAFPGQLPYRKLAVWVANLGRDEG